MAYLKILSQDFDNCELYLKTINDEMASSVSPMVVSDLIIIGDSNLTLIEWVDGLGHAVLNNGDSSFVSYLSNNFLPKYLSQNLDWMYLNK